MPDLDELLFPVFDSLRRQEVPLGVSEYLTVYQLIQAGFGTESPEALKRICRLVWTKSPEDQEILDKAFQEFIQVPRPRAKKERQEDRPLENRKERDLPDAGKKEKETPDQPEQPADQAPLSVKPAPTASQALPPVSLPDARLPDERGKNSFQIIPRMPIQSREMASAWRQLRRLKRVGPLDELDIDGTIASICQVGIFTRPVFRPRRRNEARLLLLVDVKGSMGPFAPFMKTVVESIQRSGLLGQVKTFFFNNVPEEYLFHTPGLVDTIPIDQGLAEYARGNSVLILSDGGAARGNYVESRLESTRTFIAKVAAYTYLYAWLNPLPTWRWKRTTAEEIARIIPMFPINREGLNDAVNILRGHPAPVGGRFYE